jgi:2-polyprenyl-3-methyl-5-hydroxy-6-metoxy-1,4-benzoquinol methylase
MRQTIRQYFEDTVAADPPGEREARLTWRLSCFDSGLRYADYLETHHFPLAGMRVVDVACAWGGHAMACAHRGADVVASDLLDHRLDALGRFARGHGLTISALRADCQRLPLPPASADVVIALELVEHIDSVESFAGEIARVLRPGGVCLVSTPARLRSLVQGEPHYHLKGLTVLPLALQRTVATRVFGRRYPFPIPRQYATASQVIRPFAAHGLRGTAVCDGRLGRLVERRSLLRRAARELMWSFIVVTKPAGERIEGPGCVR